MTWIHVVFTCSNRIHKYIKISPCHWNEYCLVNENLIVKAFKQPNLNLRRGYSRKKHNIILDKHRRKRFVVAKGLCQTCLWLTTCVCYLFYRGTGQQCIELANKDVCNKIWVVSKLLHICRTRKYDPFSNPLGIEKYVNFQCGAI